MADEADCSFVSSLSVRALSPLRDGTVPGHNEELWVPGRQTLMTPVDGVGLYGPGGTGRSAAPGGMRVGEEDASLAGEEIRTAHPIHATY